MKTLVIGLDAATWRVMRPLLKQGKLPAMKALVDGGASGILQSTIPPMTPLAWSSIVTGVNAGKHGIYDFVSQDRKTYSVSPLNYHYINRRPAIWDIFNFYGRKVGVVNFPMVFPPPPVDSFFISGLTSPESKNYTHPPELYGYLKSLGYRVYPRCGPNNGARRYLNEVKDLTEIQCEVTIDFMKRWNWELFWVVFQGVDWIQHYLWNKDIDGENAVKTFYCYMDSVVGRILEKAHDDWNVFILSDHGSHEIKAEIHLNNLLEEWGYLKRAEPSISFATRISGAILKTGWALWRKLPFIIRQKVKQHIPEAVRPDLRDLRGKQRQLHKRINWSQTRAFSFGYMGRIYIHEKKKYPQGIVESGIEYKKLQEEIIAQFRALKDPGTEKPVVGDIFTKEEIYAGDQLENAPDIIFNPTDFDYMVYGDFGNSWFHRPQDRLADHDMEGILIMKGKDVRRNVTMNAETVDITPTLLYLHDLPVLEDMDGRVLQEVLATDLTTRQKVRVVKNSIQDRKSTAHEPGTDKGEIEKVLRDLGYL